MISLTKDLSKMKNKDFGKWRVDRKYILGIEKINPVNNNLERDEYVVDVG